MHRQKAYTRFFLVAALTAIAVAGLNAIRDTARGGVAFTAQEKPVTSRDNKDEKAKLPLAVFATSLPIDPAERELRYARNSRYDNSYSTRLDELRPDTVERSRISHFWINLPALPTAESDAVVLGDIVDAKGYLSNDKTGAYSEFTIQVKEVLKNGDRLSDGLIIAEREGAAVQLSDGRILQYKIADQGAPRVGRSYVLFLKYNNQGKDYHILTGYEIREGQVFPLDEYIDRFATYEKTDEKVFLNVVREAVANPPQLPRRVNQ